ncbi:MAG: hypothetical protein A3K60_08180 [Euryarchaeota archaeon RBG_19FT_COMBO_56_21]|nr:MAG: hypothetical protein A3K60_08180 [Euryarchaeota archaeon RBG_19FT_COMBO_56_21]
MSPGGPDAALPEHFDLMETVDYYELHQGGHFEHTAETRYCGGGCYDIVEAMIRRDVEALVLKSVSPYTLRKFTSSGVRVYFAGTHSPRQAMQLLADSRLPELDPKTQTRRL